MVREGYLFGLPPLVMGILLLVFARGWIFALGALLVLLGLFVFSFFRNPERMIPEEAGLIVAPADGRVVVVKEESANGQPGKRVSIFLAIWNVHVNRAPAGGKITRLDYKPGKFLAAWDENASFQNEQNVFTQATEHGEIVYKQIAGWVARRVVSWKKSGDEVARGERIGLMRFGSRMDIWLPSEAEIAVKVGENVKGGSSILARMPETARVRTSVPRKRSGGTGQKMQDDTRS
ncbi:MAG: phosphatidylserine decarboxylase family protein [Candidatus Acidiferrum sp.]